MDGFLVLGHLTVIHHRKANAQEEAQAAHNAAGIQESSQIIAQEEQHQRQHIKHANCLHHRAGLRLDDHQITLRGPDVIHSIKNHIFLGRTATGALVTVTGAGALPQVDHLGHAIGIGFSYSYNLFHGLLLRGFGNSGACTAGTHHTQCLEGIPKGDNHLKCRATDLCTGEIHLCLQILRGQPHDFAVRTANLNRQLFATLSTVGMPKTEAAVKRLSDISTTCKLHPIQQFVTAEDVEEMDFSPFDLVIDAIDTVSSKLAIIKKCDRLGIPAISAMGAGNKLDPTRFEVADIYETSVCPLAAAVRRECRKAGVKGLRVVYSREEAIKPHFIPESESESRRLPPASSAFVPSVSGLIIAGEAIKILTGTNRK